MSVPIKTAIGKCAEMRMRRRPMGESIRGHWETRAERVRFISTDEQELSVSQRLQTDIFSFLARRNSPSWFEIDPVSLSSPRVV